MLNCSRNFFLTLFILIQATSLWAQNDTIQPTDTTGKIRIEILSADELVLIESERNKLRKLIGNVGLKQKDVLLYCDSAILDRTQNLVNAYGNVKINQNDTITAWGDTLIFDGNTDIAMLQQNAGLSNKETTIKSDLLYYNTDSKVAWYNTGAVITNDEATLTSIKGTYYADIEVFFFSDSVVVTHPDYLVYSDSLSYHVLSDIVQFHAPSRVINDSNEIICNTGWYDTKVEVASFGPNTILSHPPQLLFSDSIYYNDKTGIGKVYKGYLFKDTVEMVELEGEEAIYNDKTQGILSWDRPVLRYLEATDTLSICGDTLHSFQVFNIDTLGDTLSDYQMFLCYRNVKIYKSDLQGVADSLVYREDKEELTLFYDPVTWCDKSQLVGDTIRLFLKDNKPNRIVLMNNAFVSSKSDTMLFDQIKGKTITGFFKNDRFNKMLVERNCESIYFGKSDSAFLGMNKAICDAMQIRMDSNGQIGRITFYNRPEAVFTPMKKLKKADLYLEDFKWQAARRPRSKFDILK